MIFREKGLELWLASNTFTARSTLPPWMCCSKGEPSNVLPQAGPFQALVYDMWCWYILPFAFRNPKILLYKDIVETYHEIYLPIARFLYACCPLVSLRVEQFSHASVDFWEYQLVQNWELELVYCSLESTAVQRPPGEVWGKDRPLVAVTGVD